MEGIIIINIEDGVPLKTLSSGWGLGGNLIPIGTVTLGMTKKEELSTLSSFGIFHKTQEKRKRKYPFGELLHSSPQGSVKAGIGKANS